MIIRNETSSDIEAISKVTIAAFKGLAISRHTKQFIINALQKSNAHSDYGRVPDSRTAQ